MAGPDDMFSRHAERNEDDDNRPWICPGCHAFAGEEHAGYCPDAAIERDREEAQRLGEDWYDDDDD